MQHADLTELSSLFRGLGYLIPNTRRMLTELTLHLGVYLVGLWIYLSQGCTPLGWVGILASALGSLGVSTNIHTASHGALFRSRRLNQLFVYLGYPLLLGLPATYWMRKHCEVHHPNPNVVGVDEDIDFTPFLALHTADYRAASRVRRTYYEYQWVVVPFAIALNAFNMQRLGMLALWRQMASQGPRARTALDIVCLLGHVSWAVVLPALVYSTAPALACYALRSVVLSYLVFALFAPAHLPAEALCTEQPPRHLSFVARQVLTTLNFRMPALARLFACGLDHQIEHHLFPRIDHTRYLAMSPEVRAFCQAHELPYRELGWGEALRKSCVPFFRPKPPSTLLSAPHASSSSAHPLPAGRSAV